MNCLITPPANSVTSTISLNASKSESNRAHIINFLCNNQIIIGNPGNADDTVVLQELLSKINSNEYVFDVHAAGTTMRFLTALFSITEGTRVLTGTERMKSRPIDVLVTTLRNIGATITYLEREGYPPIEIDGHPLKGGSFEISGNVSSQYISALLLIAPYLQNGIELTFSSTPVSKPYINMTLEIMRYFGAKITAEDDRITVTPQPYVPKPIEIESDWSATSYYYEIVALMPQSQIQLNKLHKNSLQGDCQVAEIYEQFGVRTEFNNKGVKLTSTGNYTNNFEYDFINTPDLAQTVACTCAALGCNARLSGLSTLRIKETDRISALQNELNKIGAYCCVSPNDNLIIKPAKLHTPLKMINTYSDHRMAMALAPLSIKVGKMEIENAPVVNKSYPNYWNDLKQSGFSIEYL